MSSRTLRDSLRLFAFVITLANCSSIEFFISQAFDECSRNSQTVTCAGNSAVGGLCAYAPNVNKLWCCPAPDPYVRWIYRSFRGSRVLTSSSAPRTCWSWAQDCKGGSAAAPGPGQISCSSEGARMWSSISVALPKAKVGHGRMVLQPGIRSLHAEKEPDQRLHYELCERKRQRLGSGGQRRRIFLDLDYF